MFTKLQQCEIQLLACMEHLERHIKKLRELNTKLDSGLNVDHLLELQSSIMVVTKDLESIVIKGEDDDE